MWLNGGATTKKKKTWSWYTDRENPVTPPQLSTQVSRPPCQDEGDEDAFPILPTDDVEAQACGAFVQQHLPWLPAKTEWQRQVEEQDTQTIKAKKSTERQKWNRKKINRGEHGSRFIVQQPSSTGLHCVWSSKMSSAFSFGSNKQWACGSFLLDPPCIYLNVNT